VKFVIAHIDYQQ